MFPESREGGVILFLAAIGMMATMIGVDVTNLGNWHQMTTPVFVGNTILHLAAVISAFVGGNLLPNSRDPGSRTRKSDPLPPPGPHRVGDVA